MTSSSTMKQPTIRIGPCRRGSIAFVTLFGASFIVGLVFTLFGLGLAIRAGDAKRDAADAVAFSAASMYAHAMNDVALLNMAKLSVFSAYATTVAAESIGLPAASAYVAAQLAALDLAYLPQVPILTEFGIEVGEQLAMNVPKWQRLMRSLDQAQQALQTNLYEDANNRVKVAALLFPTVLNGFIAPERRLPLQKESPATACARILATSSVYQQLFAMFRRFQLDVGAIGLGAALAGFEPICVGIASDGGSTRELSARLGTEDFQLRGYVVGSALSDEQDRGVRVAAAWARDEGGGLVVPLRRAFSRIGLAQAEFYYDGTGPQTGLASDVLFSTKWRARMRRYRDVDGFSQFRSHCLTAGGADACAIAGEALPLARTLIIH